MNHCQKSNELGIQELTKLNEDPCTRNVDDKTRSEICNYYINDYQYCPSVPKNVEETSLNYPSILHKDGYGVHRDIVDIESNQFKTNRKLTNPRVINQLLTRTPTSVPNRSKGPGNVNDENILLSKESTFQNKQCNNLAGITIDRFLPSIPNTQQIHNQNSKFIIPEDSHSDWVRGGIDSRQIIRQQNYRNKCN